MAKTPEERFWAKVNKDGPTQPHMDTPCWIWTASLRGKGYGQFSVLRDGRRTMAGAHRLSWESLCGQIPPGMSLCHRCDNPPCINPEHLFLGAVADNSRDMVAKGRQARGERMNTHKFTIDDVLDIRARVAAGETMAALARARGVTNWAISKIVRRESWAWLGDAARFAFLLIAVVMLAGCGLSDPPELADAGAVKDAGRWYKVDAGCVRSCDGKTCGADMDGCGAPCGSGSNCTYRGCVGIACGCSLLASVPLGCNTSQCCAPGANPSDCLRNVQGCQGRCAYRVDICCSDYLRQYPQDSCIK